jgi:hypothetical protein
MKIEHIEFKAEWTSDCCGKQDYDINIIRVSTRYWPDYTVKSTIYLGDAVIYETDYIVGESEADCKVKVEKWVKEKVTEIVNKMFESSK